MGFEDRLGFGNIAEGLIATWLRARGNCILPAYQLEQATGKGPQLFCQATEFVAPDMLAFTASGIVWIEAKHKTRFSWHRATQRWTTGIDIRHYGEYLEVEKRTKLPVWLMFFHRDSAPSVQDLRQGSPPECPVGLFGGKLFDLVLSENHRAKHFDPKRVGYIGHGNSGMVYWAPESLKLLATREEVYAAEAES